MATKSLIVHILRRFPEGGADDTIRFQPGVNVLVGPPNSGKTQWLKILDYLFGNDDTAEKTFAEEVFEKYESAEAEVTVGDNSLKIERRWKERGRVVLNGKSMPRAEFCDELLRLLDIPIVHFPQGNPYGPRSWRQLGWRGLLRHMYRQQRFWADLADQQFESEQYACLMQFLGVAKNRFSDDYGALVKSKKEIEELTHKKKHFIAMLNEVSKDLVDSEDLGVSLTPQSIGQARGRIDESSRRVAEERAAIVKELQAAVAESTGVEEQQLRALGEEFATAEINRDAQLSSREKVVVRIREMSEHLALLENELARLERADASGAVLAMLKVTHCPACDRELNNKTHGDNCILCKRPLTQTTADTESAKRRLDFERKQVSSEVNEARELLAALESERDKCESGITKSDELIRSLQLQLRPSRTAASAILPPELAVCDMEIGRLAERRTQLDRIAASLQRRETIADDINRIQEKADALEEKVARQGKMIDYEREADVIADAMNTYLNQIHRVKPKLWSQSPVRLDLRKGDFRFFVGERGWRTKLGGTATLIFLMAYHYALMSLSADSSRNYPGFLTLDFPAELDDGSTVRDKENFVLEPFCDLVSASSVQTQVIAAGAAFENLDANRIELDRIWK